MLWLRRLTGSPSIERQRAAFFPGRTPARSFRIPWYRAHSALLHRSLAVRGRGRPQLSRRGGRALARRYFELGRELDAATREGDGAEIAPGDADEGAGGRAPIPSAHGGHDADQTPSTTAS